MVNFPIITNYCSPDRPYSQKLCHLLRIAGQPGLHHVGHTLARLQVEAAPSFVDLLLLLLLLLELVGHVDARQRDGGQRLELVVLRLNACGEKELMRK